MNNPLTFLKTKNKQKKIINFRINNRTITILPVSYDEMLEVVFLILPYLKLIKVIREEHKSIMEPGVFFDVIENIILQLRRDDLNKVLKIFLKQDDEFISTLTAKDLTMIAPIIIKENDIIETMFLLRNLGAFE